MLRRLSILFILPALFLNGCGGDETVSEDLPDYVHIPPSLPDSVLDSLKTGDIAIRKGAGPLSHHLMNTTKENYSHCGIIINDGGKPYVIHTIGASASEEHIDGVQTQDFEIFVANSADSMLYICRPVFVDSAGAKVAERARFYLDKQIPFDHAFSVFTTEKFYCSELLFYIFRDIGGKKVFDVEKKHKSYMLMFSTFFNTTNFTPIFHLKTGGSDTLQ